MKSPHGKKLTCLQPPATGTESCRSWRVSEIRSGSFSSWTLRWDPSAWHCPDRSLQELAQKTQLSQVLNPDPHKLSDNECVLFWASKFLNNLLGNSRWLIYSITCYSPISNHYRILLKIWRGYGLISRVWRRNFWVPGRIPYQ